MEASEQKPSLLGLNVADLPDDGRVYRSRQLAEWIYGKGAADFAEMTNLPAAWREQLAAQWTVDPFVKSERFESADGSVRYLFTLKDGKQTEAVYMPYLNRRTICISSMVVVRPAAPYAPPARWASAAALTAGSSVSCWQSPGGGIPASIRNIVLMGMGRRCSTTATRSGIRTWIDPRGLDMSPRRITLSTVGLPGKIRQLIDEELPLTLAVSLHAPDEETRRQIIPTAHAHSIVDIMASLHEWQRRIRRRVTIEYTMLEGINDHEWQAVQLAQRLEGLNSHVNLIPFNAWGESEFSSSSRAVIDTFREALEQRNVSVSVRFSRGQDAGAACGQLSLQRISHETLPLAY